MFKKIINYVLITCFLATFIIPVPQAKANTLGLPEPGTMVNLSPAYMPVMIKGLKVHPENPLLFDFILDTGKSGLQVNSPAFKAESEKLIKYFLASLTIKEDDLWVNLSPYEKDRMLPSELGKTELGRDMLAQDYILKQLTASLIYPEKKLGKEFWNRVYAKAQQMFGVTDIPVNTFNKVWIVADKAKILERNNAAYVVSSHLKVMLEEDYLALTKQSKNEKSDNSHSVASQIVREIIVPEIEKEVNQGQNFAPLRQMFYSMILASWYKLALKDALLNQVYSNKAKTVGVQTDSATKEKIYQQYLQAYKKGVFNYIKEDVNTVSKEPIPRKYFSGGWKVWDRKPSEVIERETKLAPGEDSAMAVEGDMAMVTVNVDKATDGAMLSLAEEISKLTSGSPDQRVVLSDPTQYAQGIKLGEARKKSLPNGQILFDFILDLNVRVIAGKALSLALAKPSFKGNADEIRKQYDQITSEFKTPGLVDNLTPPQLGRLTYDIVASLTGDADPHSERDNQVVAAFQRLYDAGLEKDVGLDKLEQEVKAGQISENWKEVLFRTFVLSSLSSATDDTFFGMQKVTIPILGELGESIENVDFNNEDAVKQFLDQVAQKRGLVFNSNDSVPVRLFKLAQYAVGESSQFTKIQGRDAFDKWVSDIAQNKNKPIVVRIDDKEDFVIIQLKVKTLLLAGFKVILAAAEKSIMNDATITWLNGFLADRQFFKEFIASGQLRVVSTGTGVAGTDLTNTGKEFNDALAEASSVIAEGTTNQESIIQEGLMLSPSVVGVSMSGKKDIQISFQYQPGSPESQLAVANRTSISESPDREAAVVLRGEQNPQPSAQRLSSALEDFYKKIEIRIPGYVPQRPFNKAIRDNILNIIIKNGDEVPVWIKLDQDSWEQFLVAKIFEEFIEFQQTVAEEGQAAKGATLIEEASDILEIIDGINKEQKWFGDDFVSYLRAQDKLVGNELPSEQQLIEQITDDIVAISKADRNLRQDKVAALIIKLIQFAKANNVNFEDILSAKSKKKGKIGGFERRLFYVGKFYNQEGFDAFQQIGQDVAGNSYARKVSVQVGERQTRDLEIYTGGMKQDDFTADTSFDMNGYLRDFPKSRIEKMLPNMLGNNKTKFLEILSGESKEKAIARIAEMIREQSAKSPVMLENGSVGTQEITLDVPQIEITADGQANFVNLLDLLFKAHPGVTRDFVAKDIFGKAGIVEAIVKDFAMNTKPWNQGGIDFNAKNLNLNVAKDGKGIQIKFDAAMVAEFQRGNFTGVVPHILRIVPIQSPLPILGLGTGPEAKEVARI